MVYVISWLELWKYHGMDTFIYVWVHTIVYNTMRNDPSLRWLVVTNVLTHITPQVLTISCPLQKQKSSNCAADDDN